MVVGNADGINCRIFFFFFYRSVSKSYHILKAPKGNLSKIVIPGCNVVGNMHFSS
jgi:hypothetical protein